MWTITGYTFGIKREREGKNAGMQPGTEPLGGRRERSLASRKYWGTDRNEKNVELWKKSATAMRKGKVITKRGAGGVAPHRGRERS